MPLPAPTNLLTRNAGGGLMEARWDAPVSGVVDYYDFYIATAAGGPYEKANAKPLTVPFAKIQNLKYGVRIYSKVRAIDADGVEGALSAVGLDSTCARAVMTMRFTGPLGDVIPEGGIFAAVCNDELIAVRILEEGTITGG